MIRKNKILMITILISLFNTGLMLAVPPVPENTTTFLGTSSFPSEIFNNQDQFRQRNIPDSILVLRADFQNVSFDLVPDFPDSLPHDIEYFNRFMIHMSDYFNDASHGNYVIGQDNYTIHPNIITLPHNMAYYGNDDEWTERIAEFAVDLIEGADTEIDFNDYDSYIVFHAGAGQEADLSGDNEDELWSTFLTRRSLQAGLDPENDDFPGILADGKYLREFVIYPETEWQPDNTEESPIYGMIGVIMHQFGHQIGLPTLFDNVSSNGRSFGIGNFGVMGTGAWNAMGYVPPLPCAWSRFHMGWEDGNITEISSIVNDVNLLFPMANNNLIPKLAKVEISENEYFLLENRQQNPDDSEINGEASFTFTHLPEGEQDVYPEDHPNAGQAKFNFMENSYLGCEWDFYLPGLGGSGLDAPFDGSGILIWHIDEIIIDYLFDDDFEVNQVNGTASHKGVDLEEADGTQHLDNRQSVYSLGSGDDSYREGNNDYFGKNIYPGTDFLWLPTAESNYGGTQLEIFDIGPSENVMTFSVNYEWSLDSDYAGSNEYGAAVIDFYGDNDGMQEIFYAMPGGRVYMWSENEFIDELQFTTDSLAAYYAYDENSRTFLVPCKFIPDSGIDPGIARMQIINEDHSDYNSIYTNRIWAGPPVINPNTDSSARALLPLNYFDSNNSEIQILDSNFDPTTIIGFPDTKISSNLMLKNDSLYCFSDAGNSERFLQKYNIETGDLTSAEFIGFSAAINSALLADIDKDSIDEVIVTSDSLLYVFKQDGSILPGFPAVIPLYAYSVPSVADISGNGYLDILIGGENTFAVADKNGNFTKPHYELSIQDSSNFAAGVIAVDIDDDGQKEIIGNMSLNRLCIWENENSNDYEMKRYYPISFSQRSLSYPIVSSYKDSLNGEFKSYIFVSGNNGLIFRQEIADTDLSENYWTCEYANLGRTASYLGELPISVYNTSKIFVEKETYFYPNPLNTTFKYAIDFHNSVSEKTIILKILTAEDVKAKLKIFDVAANIILSKTVNCEAGIDNKIHVDAKKLSSGVYFGILNAKGETLKLKFAIEK